ncbi:MAG TPA: hypothetical protein VLM40_11570, partial [Gemmata sp.]|nr:hypothetical protein [Gemmata sp.]
MFWKGVLPLAGLAVVLLGVRYITAQDKKPKGDDREADRQAIQKLAEEFTQSFNNRDAVAVAANYTAEGEYVRNDGEAIRGREEIQKGYADFFKTL